MDAALARLESAKLELERYRQEHEAVALKLDGLSSRVTRAQENAKKCFAENRSVLGDQYGGFSVQGKRGVDAARLVELFPDAIALVKYTMSVEELDGHVASGTIPDEIAEQCTIVLHAIKSPK